MQTNIKTNTLKSWLFGKPLIFTLMFCLCSAIGVLVGGLINTIFNPEDTNGAIIMAITTFIPVLYSIYYVIKKLPHDDMRRNDFIAITNGASLIALAFSIVSLIAIDLSGISSKHTLMFLYAFYPLTFKIMFSFIAIITIYLIGVAITSIYAKYKRCTTLGISPWKVILSMPFAFLMLWTPGYLIAEKSQKSNLQIKSKWYASFNKWVVATSANTLFVFLILLLCRDVIAGIPTLLLSVSLLVIYALWNGKHKKDLIKNINKGYALTAVGINLAIIIAMFMQHM